MELLNSTQRAVKGRWAFQQWEQQQRFSGGAANKQAQMNLCQEDCPSKPLDTQRYQTFVATKAIRRSTAAPEPGSQNRFQAECRKKGPGQTESFDADWVEHGISLQCAAVSIQPMDEGRNVPVCL